MYGMCCEKAMNNPMNISMICPFDKSQLSHLRHLPISNTWQKQMRSSKTSNGKIHYINGDVYYRCFHQVEKIEKKTLPKKVKNPNLSRLNPSSFRMLVEATYPIWLAFVVHRLAPKNRAFQGHGPPGPPLRSMPTSNLHDLNKCHGPTASQFPKKKDWFSKEISAVSEINYPAW